MDFPKAIIYNNVCLYYFQMGFLKKAFSKGNDALDGAFFDRLKLYLKKSCNVVTLMITRSDPDTCTYIPIVNFSCEWV